MEKEKFEGIKMSEMDKMKLKELKGEDLWEGDSWIYDVADRYATDKAEGGRIGLDAGGPPISPANLHPLQRPMFYQGGLTKTIPPERGPMPQGLQSDVYDGIMRPGVINGRN